VLRPVSSFVLARVWERFCTQTIPHFPSGYSGTLMRNVNFVPLLNLCWSPEPLTSSPIQLVVSVRCVIFPCKGLCALSRPSKSSGRVPSSLSPPPLFELSPSLFPPATVFLREASRALLGGLLFLSRHRLVPHRFLWKRISQSRSA